MGATSFPVTLSGWAQYCDCLESLTRFQHSDSQPSEQISANVQVFQQKFNRQGVDEQGEAPVATRQKPQFESLPPAKRGKQLHRSKHRPTGQLRFKNVAKNDTIDQVSDLIEVKRPQDNIFDLSNLNEEENIDESHLYHLYKPTIFQGQEPDRKARTTAPFTQYIHAQKEHADDQGDTFEVLDLRPKAINSSRTYFVNQQEQQQYAKEILDH